MGFDPSNGTIALIISMGALIWGLTGADLVGLVSLIIGSSAATAVVTGLFGLRKSRAETKIALATSETTSRTVAAETAEAAMRMMGEAMARTETQRAAAEAAYEARLAACEQDCKTCNERWQGHASVCPLLGGTPP